MFYFMSISEYLIMIDREIEQNNFLPGNMDIFKFMIALITMKKVSYFIAHHKTLVKNSIQYKKNDGFSLSHSS